MKHVIVGTAGHIDHGKTSLVRALTGTDTDRFKEEKERGITIDIGFANLDLDDGTRIGFVDVPGHERFIKNMLAGIGGIDVVMLVVAADESVMPQTREHLEICSLLRVQRGFTVITKVDAVETDLADLVELEVRDYLNGSFLSDSPIVRFSSATLAGRDTLIATLSEIAGQVRVRDSADVFRLPVDRCFTMRGFGTVVTGTLISGAVDRDAPVELLPGRRSTRVRGIQVHGVPVDRAEAGQRTALNLQGVEVGEVERGMVLTSPNLLRSTSVIDCHLELLGSAPKAITRRKRIRFHAGTAEIMGYVRVLGADRLEPGQSGFAQIRLESPTLVVPGDRFILRQYSPMTTIGGGEVLEVDAGKHRTADKRVVERLAFLRTCDLEARLDLLVGQRGLEPVPHAELVFLAGSGPDRVRQGLETLVSRGSVQILSAKPLVVASSIAIRDAADRALKIVEAFHESNPLSPGISRDALYSRAFPHVAPGIFQFLMELLLGEKKLEAMNEIVHLRGRRVVLTEDERRARDAILAEFRKLGLQAPPPAEVTARAELGSVDVGTILKFMVREGSLARISDELIVDQLALEGVIDQLRARKSTDQMLSVGDFKEVTGVSRKYAIPILEHLDRIRVTRRQGNDRVII